MPTNTEVEFFKSAFKFLDNHQNTNWFQTYSNLLAQNQDDRGRINWNRIPGLLPRGTKGGYFAAIRRVGELLVGLGDNGTSQSQRDQGRYKTVTRMAKEVYESRKDHLRDVQLERGVFNYFIFICPFTTCCQTEDTKNHKDAKHMWKMLWMALDNKNINYLQE